MTAAQQWGLRLGAVIVSIAAAAAVTSGWIEVPGIDTLTLALARLTVITLDALGVPASSEGAVVVADGFAAIIVMQCTAVDIAIVFSTAVLVWPASFKARVLALILCIPALCALNFVRIISLLLIGMAIPHYFDIAHYVIWQPVMAFTALCMWLFWMRRTSDGKSFGEL